MDSTYKHLFFYLINLRKHLSILFVCALKSDSFSDIMTLTSLYVFPNVMKSLKTYNESHVILFQNFLSQLCLIFSWGHLQLCKDIPTESNQMFVLLN
jgi:hypothetical protein